MTTRLLAVIAEAATATACLEAAYAAACVLQDAEIQALHVVVDPSYRIGSADEIALQRLRERAEGSAQTREAATRDVYEQWRSDRPAVGGRIAWKSLIGPEEESVELEAKSFDLLVLARPHNLDGHDALYSAIYRVRRPLLFVPQTWHADEGLAFGRHICIAWRDTPSCERAIAGALPWLRHADQVAMLTISVDHDGARRLRDRLAGEGLSVQVFRVEPAEPELGEQILSEAHRLGADLVVMGAYRHNWLFEHLVRSTTRQVLAAADLPLLISH